MALLECTTPWKQSDQRPVEFELTLQSTPNKSDWVVCTTKVTMVHDAEANLVRMSSRRNSLPKRELLRLQGEVSTLAAQQAKSSLTFVPIVPSFELWLSPLSDQQYRIIIWLDMAAELDGTSDLAYQGLRYTTDLSRLRQFATQLKTELAL